MGVTEFAILYLVSGSPSEEVLNTLDEAQTILDKWTLKKHPKLPATRTARGTGMLQQVEDPSAILLTALWASPQDHWDWIATEENQEAMGKLMPLIIQDGAKKLILFHIDAEIFTPNENQPSLLESPILGTWRFIVDFGKKQDFEAEVIKVKEALATATIPVRSEYGWRIEKESGSEECVMFCGWNGGGDDGIPSEVGAQLSRLGEIAKGSDSKRYGRLL